MKFILTIAISLIVLSSQSPALARERLAAGFVKQITRSESGLEYSYNFVITNLSSGEPVNGVVMEVTTDMPAMPGAHHMPAKIAEPSGEPGMYIATIDFDMPGKWTLKLNISEPYRDIVTLSDTVEKYHCTPDDGECMTMEDEHSGSCAATLGTDEGVHDHSGDSHGD
ncbi:FixH family protein [Pseudohalocynthiibacter sp. F2068]|uniref:FixH family protein n=1 Tax=Pseudohalocynthiibacter sp. F2068 TaxID=2926418 RepID=UPI001FF1DE02|nr:FixH family protein [Pseudohalocynthiibacter sp. F2068]MCK0103239.1 FixH family protein [Pseudohalocynthiibacter sp. F2068]